MRRATRWFEAKGRGKAARRIGLMFGALTLFCSTQLLGNGGHETASGQDIQVAKPPRHELVISIPDRKLALTQDGRVLKVYSVAVGAAVSPSPTGSMKIVDKVVDPAYYHLGQVIPPGKSNPLGDRWIGLNDKGYGIHGTNVPSSVGHAASHGCFRMRKHDVEELFNLVRVGDPVEIHGERDEQIAEIFAATGKIADSRSKGRLPAPDLQSSVPRATQVSD